MGARAKKTNWTPSSILEDIYLQAESSIYIYIWKVKNGHIFKRGNGGVTNSDSASYLQNNADRNNVLLWAYWTVSFVFAMDERFLLLFVNVLPILEYQTQASCSTTSSSMEQVGKPNPIMPPWYENCIIIWTLKKTKKWSKIFRALIF